MAEQEQEKYQGPKQRDPSQDYVKGRKTKEIKSLIVQIDGLVEKDNLADKYRQQGGQ